jgi:hypothetical protein
MNGEELFRDFWWLIFPVFGMLIAIWGMASSERRTASVLDLIKSYTDQGKEPPAELLRLAAQQDSDSPSLTSPGKQNSTAWTFVVFAALAAGFGAGWYMMRGEDIEFAFAIVAIAMGVMALGGLFILIFGRK